MILYKFASRSRPAKLLNCLQNIKSLAKEKYMVLVTLDYDDDLCNDIAFRHRLTEHKNVFFVFGYSKNKIDAINRDIELFPREWDVLINMSDDMFFYKEGFDTEIREAFGGDYDQFIHWDDGNQRDSVCTMSIMGKDYFDRFGYIYHPDYESLWCDCEATEVAKELGKYKYMGDGNILFKHLHPSFGLGQYDEQYRRTEAHALRSKDEQVYLQRKAKRHPKKSQHGPQG